MQLFYCNSRESKEKGTIASQKCIDLYITHGEKLKACDTRKYQNDNITCALLLTSALKISPMKEKGKYNKVFF